MTRSMTAYALEERAAGQEVVSCEIRTVNHRYLDVSLRLPDELRAMDGIIRERIAAVLARGKVDVTIHRRQAEVADSLQVDEAMLARLQQLAAAMRDQFGSLQVEFTELLRFPGVMRRQESDADALQGALLAALDAALQGLAGHREREGQRLGQQLSDRLQRIEAALADFRRRLPLIRAALHARLQQRLAGLVSEVAGLSLDAGRVEQELAVQLTRMDVDEELDRLDSHIAETRRILSLDEPAGRRLDFLMQEFNREANTLGSKSIDKQASATIVELKVLIEQMREQVQNIE
ncbi:YicC/YloC family endoribonuclease [Frateuria aurantia]|uniref:TIGR00255 family protein n=1 Tax=Frateuria aurantia (strain ATCC 33424 / DSM 6220 / KCTC 2777 / LMG 1558 / NBRC 3245 / NCIMB 13370) TaxID=767434 RepID=H8L3U5_FRAAD|nr:YicC/YloC family endoribonuclease [Frateuria aurantia]AFC84900.1 TIGR00255 family protein [Frateuria aurantia DSM 6220]